MRFLAENEEGGVEVFDAETWEDAEETCLNEVWELQGEIVAIISGDEVNDPLEGVDLSNIVVTNINSVH